MISSLIYSLTEQEINELMGVIKDIAADTTDEKWDISKFLSVEQVDSFLNENPLLDMAFYNVTKEDEQKQLKKIRKEYDGTRIMVLSDNKTSPMQYMQPSIKAQSLLLRPYSKEIAKRTILEFVKEYLESIYEGNSKENKALVVDSREGKISIPYNKIFYIEALDKKIFISTGVEEYGFYSTLDKIEEELPDNFKRCHRSFIVNTDKIVKIAVSKGTIGLIDGYEVPLSRSYKPKMKEVTLCIRE